MIQKLNDTETFKKFITSQRKEMWQGQLSGGCENTSCIIQTLLNSLILRTPKHQNGNVRKQTSCLPKQLLKMVTTININSSWLSHNNKEKHTDKISNYHLIIAYTVVLSFALSHAEELRMTVIDIIFCYNIVRNISSQC